MNDTPKVNTQRWKVNREIFSGGSDNCWISVSTLSHHFQGLDRINNIVQVRGFDATDDVNEIIQYLISKAGMPITVMEVSSKMSL